MKRKTQKRLISALVVTVAVAAAVTVAYDRSTTLEIPIPVFGEDGKMTAKFIKIKRRSGLLAALVQVRGGRQAVYDPLSTTQNGQAIIHGPAAPQDLHVSECAPQTPMTAPEVFQGLGPANANAWGYRYANHTADSETQCVKNAANAGLSVDNCFVGVGTFFGQADGFAFVNPAGVLDIPNGDPYALVIASMKVVFPQTSRVERCSLPATAVCGDGFIDPPEDCDDGNTQDGDACSSTCRTTQCSDGMDNDLDNLVDCADAGCHSDGNATNQASCVVTNPETNTVTCGNGAREGSEQCDDGNTVNNDTCSNVCQINPACQDGLDNDSDGLIDIADPGCHGDGNATNPASYIPSKATEDNMAMCGNGVVDAGEQCDDGNTSNFDTCKVGCQNNVCGDGYPLRAVTTSQPGDPCDDGNTVSGDGCSSTCITEPTYNCDFTPAISKDKCTIPIGGGV